MQIPDKYRRLFDLGKADYKQFIRVIVSLKAEQFDLQLLDTIAKDGKSSLDDRLCARQIIDRHGFPSDMTLSPTAVKIKALFS